MVTDSLRTVAAVDCGTNSIRLLIQSVDEQGRRLDLLRAMTIVRLGENVDATGEFTAAALDRTSLALAEFVGRMQAHRVTELRMVATSAARDVSNRAEFFGMTAELLSEVVPGSQAEVITGALEAELSFRGVIAELEGSAEPTLVVDIGGGSTELVLGASGEVRAAHSADIGCVRLTERFVTTDPISRVEQQAVAAAARAALDEAAAVVPVRQARQIVGVAGTLTTIAALALGLDHYDSDRIHRARVSSERFATTCRDLLALDRDTRLALGPMHPGRADVIGAGAIIALEIIEMVSLPEIVISEHDILDGIALSI